MSELSLESYATLWRAFGIDRDTEKRLIDQTQAYLANHDVVLKAERLYETTVRRLSEELFRKLVLQTTL